LQFPLTVIEEAVDGNEALKKVDDFLPALILMDIQLPEGSGLLLAQKIKEGLRVRVWVN
jgi:YesN/AraC family two-component response regulator